MNLARRKLLSILQESPTIYKTLVLLGWIHPNLPDDVPSPLNQPSVVGEGQTLLSEEANRLPNHFDGELTKSSLEVAVPKLGSLWCWVLVTSLANVVINAVIAAKYAGYRLGAIIWLLVLILQIGSSQSYPSSFVLATLSSSIGILDEILAFARNPSLWLEFSIEVYLVAIAYVLCFLLYSAIRSRREEDEDEHFKASKMLVPCREPSSSILSQLTFNWMSPLIRLGKMKHLTIDDIPDLADIDKAQIVVGKFNAFRRTTKIKNLGYQLIYFELGPFLLQLFYSLASNSLVILCPFLLYKITYFIEQDEKKGSLSKFSPNETFFVIEPVVLALLLGLATLLKSAFNAQPIHIGRKIGVRVRAILIDAIYQKGLRKAEIAKRQRPKQNVAANDSSNEPENDESKNVEEPEDVQKDAAASVGKIVTMMSSDTEKLREACAFLYFGVTSPPQIIGSVVGLIYLLGWPAVGGLFVMLLMFPATYYISEYLNIVYDDLMGRTDKRTTIVNEMLQGIKMIKFFAWEKNFEKKIQSARGQEIKSIVKLFIQNAIATVVWEGSPLVVSFTTFFVYTYVAGYKLDAKTAFASISLLNGLRVPLLRFPEIMVNIFRLKVSIQRIQSFLDEEELDRFKSDASSHGLELREGDAVCFKDCDFTWRVEKEDAVKSGSTLAMVDESTPLLCGSSSLADEAKAKPNDIFTLRNLNFAIPSGKLTVICGATGAGKSSLIQALLGEMKCLSGSFRLKDPSEPIAYVAQTSWLMNATIRDNICFGEIFDAVRYDRVIRACALARDLETFDSGDLTEIGEKGINLSGGQKQRVSLARAAYSRSNFIIMDDPLSAVDAPTARHLFEQVICGLMKDTTRLLVTHAVSLSLPAADQVIVMRNGEVAGSGDVPTVLGIPEVRSILPETSALSLQNLHLSGGSLRSGTESVQTPHAEPVDYGRGKTREDAKKLIDAEESQKGSVKFSVYVSYLAAAGGIIFLTFFMMGLTMERAAQTMESFWIKEWVEAYKSAQNRSSLGSKRSPFYKPKLFVAAYGPSLLFDMPYGGSLFNSSSWNLNAINLGLVSESHAAEVNTLFYVMVYAGVVLFWMFCNQLAFAIRCFGSITASRKLHDKLISRILGAPLRFFETVPLGRILNRATSDISSIDLEVMESYYDFFALTMDILTIVAVISVITPAFVLIFIPFMIIYYNIAVDYLASSREFKRFDSVTKSPIYAIFSESLIGASTIRAYAAMSRFHITLQNLVNVNHRAYFYLWASNRWLGLRISIVASMVITMSAVIVVLSRRSLGPELAAISLIWSLNFMDSLTFLIRRHAQLEMSMNSVERIEEYLEIKQEAPGTVDRYRPPANWPTSGTISVRNLDFRYAPDQDRVLKNLNFDIPGGSKVGIVGRTGAGKSSFTIALFRIVEPSGGSITIDGLDISSMGLGDLRSKLTIIPQDPVLFAGTIRSNMDPFDEYTDAKIWSSLERVHLLETMSTSSHSDPTPVLSLEYAVSAGGQNFSQGQRQLLCLARALLRDSKIAVLDEATASVDLETDSRIQEAIRGPDFAKVTVISIAHRLHTIAD
ncbi:hypothetical protein HDU97_007369, partial [Phlyctochytrium planicorne]